MSSTFKKSRDVGASPHTFTSTRAAHEGHFTLCFERIGFWTVGLLVIHVAHLRLSADCHLISKKTASSDFAARPQPCLSQSPASVLYCLRVVCHVLRCEISPFSGLYPSSTCTWNTPAAGPLRMTSSQYLVPRWPPTMFVAQT